jgi:hypothetical protein
MDRIERYRGSLLGLAIGDALGTTLEFELPGTSEPIDDMVGDGPFKLRPGEWTDDTSMALCLAESLIECGGGDPIDQLRRYVRWYREGCLSSNGTCFDIGDTVWSALGKFELAGEPNCGATAPYSAGQWFGHSGSECRARRRLRSMKDRRNQPEQGRPRSGRWWVAFR